MKAPFLAVLLGLCSCAALSPAASVPKIANDPAAIDALLALAKPGEDSVFIGDMGFKLSYLQERKRALQHPIGPKAAPLSGVTTWPGGVVPYAFDGSVTNSQKQKFVDATKVWTGAADLTFVPRSTETNYLHVVTTTENSSYMGMQGGAQPLNMQDWDYKMVICHELAHALGIAHEQCRPDRDTFVTIHSENIRPGMEHNFDLLSTSTPTPYDFSSIMHYSPYAFSVNGQRTISPKPGYESQAVSMGQLLYVTLYDKQGMVSLYGPPVQPNLRPHQPAGWSDRIVTSSGPGTTLDTALYYTDSIYVDWAVINDGVEATSESFYTELLVDGELRMTWITSGTMNQNTVASVPDFSIGSLAPGEHTLKLRTDTTFAIQEGDELDNEYVKTITVNGPPTITDPPDNVVILPGNTAFFFVSATGPALSFQWYQGNSGDTSTPVGASSPDFTTPALTSTRRYWVRVSNPFGHQDSPTVQATVIEQPVIQSPLEAGGVMGQGFSYQITALNAPTSYSASGLPPGLSVNGGSGLISGTPTAWGTYHVRLSATNGHGAGTAVLTLQIHPAAAITVNLNSDPGWLREGQWAYGTPLGGGGSEYGHPDPSSGATGTKVFGVNLAGDYDTNQNGPFYLTAGPFNLQGRTGAILQFQRWLNTDFSPYATATVEVSPNGATWYTLWENGNEEEGEVPSDSAWKKVSYKLPAIVDGKATVHVRWSYGTDFDTYAYSGWNIDDVEILAAATTQVTSVTDENNGNLNPASGTGVSLREALLHSPANSLITFAPQLSGELFLLSSGQISINKNLTIDASALGHPVLIARNTSGSLARLLEVQSGRTVILSSVRFADGSLSLTNSNQGGAGILNNGTLILRHCHFRNCSAYHGGAIENNSNLTLEDCTFTANTTRFHGGAIDSEGPLTATGCTFYNNIAGDADGGGGAIQQTANTVTLISCTITGNSAAYGGAIDGDNSSVLDLVSCTVSGNHATRKGGAIEESAGTLRLKNCIVSGNTCAAAAGTDRGGPDIFGGIDDHPGTTSQGINLLGSLEKLSGGFDGIVGQPLLRELDNHGGPTLTRPPLPGSPGVDAGEYVFQLTDQRGAPRLSGAFPDLGAVEIPGSLAVTHGDDYGPGSLREVLMQATSEDTITFHPDLEHTTIYLYRELVVDKHVTIDASALPEGIRWSNSGVNRLLRLTGEGVADLHRVTLTHSRTEGNGGAIFNAGSLVLYECKVTDCEAIDPHPEDEIREGFGGGIYNEGGDLSLHGSSVENNNADADGGGIYDVGGYLSLNSSVIAGNSIGPIHGQGRGAGVASEGGIGYIERCRFLKNYNYRSSGGGISFREGELTLDRCTFEGNYAESDGGAMHFVDAAGWVEECLVAGNRAARGTGATLTDINGECEVTVLKSTFTENRARESAGAILLGGEAILHLHSSTLHGNSASTDAGGIYNEEGEVHISSSTISGNSNKGVSSFTGLTLENTVIAGNAGDPEDDYYPGIDLLCGPTTTASGVNFVGDPTGAEGLGTLGIDYLTGNPHLLPLSYRGGSTPVMLPAPGSPLIDASTFSPFEEDQRGYHREAGEGVDIGAAEFGPEIPTVTVTTSEDEDNGPGVGGVSLRDAVKEADEGNVINFATELNGRTLVLGSPLAIDRNLTIDASAADHLTLSGAGASRIIEVKPGAAVFVDSLRIVEGSSPDDGGGVLNEGYLAMQQCEISGNATTGSGSGLANHGTARLNECTLSSNQAEGRGGAIYNAETGNLALTACTLSANEAEEGGGAVYLTANEGDDNYDEHRRSGTAIFENCTIAHNNTPGDGGGILSHAGSDREYLGRLVLESCTISRNYSAANGGGLDTVGVAMVGNTIVAPNIADLSGPDIHGELEETGVNLVSADEGIIGYEGLVEDSPMLELLGDYGGPTETMPPRPGSPAIDAGSHSLLATDQRGLPRRSGAAVDIGAVELKALASPADLASLGLSAGILTPDFDPEVLSYTAEVESSTSSIVVTPVAAMPDAVIRVNGEIVDSGSPSEAIPLSAGSNEVTILVTSADGLVTKTYTLEIIRGGAPEIEILYTGGALLSDGSDTVEHGSVPVGAVVTRQFTIRNTGDTDLTISSFFTSGPNFADFSTGLAGLTPVIAPGGNTSFTLGFKPSASGPRTATLQIASDDADEAVFDIALSGLGVDPAASPAGDGIPNLLKFAFNMDLSAPDVRILEPGTGTAGLPSVLRTGQGAGAKFRIEYLRRKGSQLTYTPKISGDLANFQPLAAVPVVTPISSAWERVVVEIPAPSPRAFAIVEVEAP